jgi:microcystin-dependent protein
MPSTYTGSGIELIAPGEQSGTWNVTTNLNLQIIDRMTSQAGTISLSGTTHTLTVSDGALSDGQYGVLVFTGLPSGTNTVTISPNTAQRTFFVRNTTAQAVVLTQGTGGNVTVPANDSLVLYCDGGGGNAQVVSLTPAPPPPEIPPGLISLWSGTIANIPAGWLLCDGTNGTPDLRDRFVVGAGSTYTPGTTGGANSVTLNESQIPGHVHSFSATTAGGGGHSHTYSGTTSTAGAHTHGITDPGHSHTTSADYVSNLPTATDANAAGAPTNTFANGVNSNTTGITINSAGDHSHTFGGTTSGVGDHTHTVSGTTGITGGTTAHENRPPFFALAYIMKS